MQSTPRRVAMSAASLTRLARSAPEKPGVLAAISARLTSGASGLPRVCTCRIASRAADAGRSMTTPSIEPARPQESRIEHIGAVGRRQHDGEIAPGEAVHLREELVQRLLALVVARRPARCRATRPTASISSMKMIAGAAFLASSKSSRTREAPTPTKSSMNSEPLIEKNGTPDSPATARATSVLPVPGGPTSKTPARHLSAESPKALRLPQKIDNLLQVLLGER